MTAKAHGLTEFEKTLEESIHAMEGVDKERILRTIDQYARKSKTLLPLRPVYT